MRKLIAAALLLLSAGAHAQVVNFLDPAVYTKPAPVAVAMPNETTSPHWYVNYSIGSGTACTQAAPCATLSAVAGKTGTAGGPAYIYVKGNGYLNLTSGSLFGAPGAEIVVKPWPADSTPTVWTAQSGCTRPSANTVSASGVHDIIFDGGPDMLLRFVGSGCLTDQNGYTLVASSNNLTFYRVRMNGNASSGPVFGPAVGSGTNQANLSVINSEIYNSKYYGVYGGGGTGCTAGDTRFDNMVFRNNIVRDAEGRGIQVEPRAASNGFIADGNAFHNIGYDRSGFNAGPSAAVQPAGSCGGVTANIVITNNVGWDLGGGCVRVDYSGVGGASGFKILNNTFYDYGKSSLTANKSSHCIGVDTAGYQALVENNILSHNNAGNQGVCAIDCSRGAGLTTSKNLCESTDGACGSSAILATAANTFQLTTPTSLNFLKLKTTSTAVDAGVTLTDALKDYTGKNRPQGAARDIGAFESGTGNPANRPNPPKGS